MNRLESLFWVGIGVTAVAAYKLTIHQLESFKKDCLIVTETSREVVDKATENAIKLDTLATLSRAVNFNLSRAAIRIVAERCLHPSTFNLLLHGASSTDAHKRHEALKTIRFLTLSTVRTYSMYEADYDHVLSKECEHKLYTQSVYNALVRACINSLPRELPDGTTTIRDEESERYALECLRCLINAGNLRPLLEAGIVDYMKAIPTKKHPHIVAAFHDREYQPESYPLWEIYSLMVANKEAEKYLKEAGIYIAQRQKIVGGLRVAFPTDDDDDDEDNEADAQIGQDYAEQIRRLHLSLMEQYPEARTVREALEMQRDQHAANMTGAIQVWE